MEGISLQRLFSNFANGWPGLGLLAQRVLIAGVLIYSVVTHIPRGPKSVALPELIGAGLSIFVLVGLWTPVVGGLTSLTEIWVLLYCTGDSWIPIIAATLSATLAMIGPGAGRSMLACSGENTLLLRRCDGIAFRPFGVARSSRSIPLSVRSTKWTAEQLTTGGLE